MKNKICGIFGLVAFVIAPLFAEAAIDLEAIQPDGFSVTNGGNYNAGTVLGYGMVPIQSCINALTRVGYDGYVSLEFEGLEECLPAVQAGYNYLKKVIK